MTYTTNQSSYVRYLPPVLWEGDNSFLSTMLRAFEKILTGIDDGVLIQHGGHEHAAIEAVIAQLYQLFDPWRTPSQFLDWLASWTDLDLPPYWNEYQRRNAIARVVPIYQQRGLKDGLDRYIELYVPAEKRPRIAIDNGSRVLFIQPQPEIFAQISTLVGQKPYLYKDAQNKDLVLFEGPIAPRGIALAPDGSLIMCDEGAKQQLTPTLKFGVGNGIWRVLPFGQNTLPQTPAPGQPQRVGPPFVDLNGNPVWSLSVPMAIAVDNLVPWHVYALSASGPPQAPGPTLYQFTSPNFSTPNVIASASAQGSSWTISYPVAMTYDTTSSPTNGHLLILDRGIAPASGSSSPKLIDINVQASPVTITTFSLTNVVEPLSLALLSNGDLIIGDGRQQNASVPANLMHVVRSTTSSSWAAMPLFNVLPTSLKAVLFIPSDPTDPAAGKYKNITTALAVPPENGYTLTAPGTLPAQSGQPAQPASPVQFFLGFDTQVTTPLPLHFRLSRPVGAIVGTNTPQAAITRFTYSTAAATDPATWPQIPAANVVDNTKGLQQDGNITITPPADWASQAPTSANQQPPPWATPPATLTDRVTNALFWLGITIVNQIPATTGAAPPVRIGIGSILFNPPNPFIAPVAVVNRDDLHLFVLDLGLKPYLPIAALDPNLTGKPFLRDMAEPAVVYSVELGKTPADIGNTPLLVGRASEKNQLVYPTGMVQDQQGVLYISDRGEYSDPALSGAMLDVWRATPHEFGVAIHFSEQRATTAQDRSQIMQTITQIVTLEKPAHTDWATVYAVDEVVQ